MNVGGSDRLSRKELGEILCDAAGFDKRLIEPVTMDDVPEVPKVEDVSLDISGIRSLGIEPLPAADAMKEILDKMKDFCAE